MYCGMPKGTSQAEVTSNRKKTKREASTVIELCLASSQSVSQSEENSVKYF